MDLPVKMVGGGLDAPKRNPRDPQAYLQGSNHPYAPFTGDAIKWSSFVYDDGTTYEGLTREDAPHVKGVLILGNGLGGGIQEADRGDKYEGEFYSGFVNGIGQYTGANGEVYRGEWLFGKRHGCGALIDTKPFLKKVEKGVDPDKAWQQTKDDIERNTAYGTWQSDAFLTGPDDAGRFCHMAEIKGVLQELESVVTKARMFQWKPDGEVTMRFAQDAVGVPAPLMQDPIHYPHGTKFMAPGPMGQCFPLPDDENLVAEMQRHAENHQRIYNMYNFDVVPQPGSDMDKAQARWNKIQARKAARIQRARELERQRMLRRDRTARRSKPSQPKDGGTDQQASAGGVASAGSSSGSQPPTVFASISLGLGRVAATASGMLHALSADAQRRCRPLLPPSQPRS